MSNLKGKRFVFAITMGICTSIVTILLKYPDVSYIKLVGILAGIFTLGQTYSDIKENGKKNEGGETKWKRYSCR